MPRVVVTKNVLPGPYPIAGVAANETAADVAQLNAFPLTGREILIARNTDTVPHNVNVTSTPDFAGRSQNITNDSVAAAGAAGSVKVYGPFAQAGWQQSADGMLYFSSDSALVKFTVLQIP